MFATREMRRLACGGLIVIASVASVLAQTTVAVSPAGKNVLPGGTFTLNVVVNNVGHFHAAHTVVTFNNAVLQGTTLAFGTFLTGPPGSSGFFATAADFDGEYRDGRPGDSGQLWCFRLGCSLYADLQRSRHGNVIRDDLLCRPA